VFCGPAQGSLRNNLADLMTPIMKIQKNDSRGKIILYQSPEGRAALDVSGLEKPGSFVSKITSE